MPIGVFFFGMALMSLAALHLNRNLSPFPYPKKESKLSTSGAYNYIQHPIYTGLALNIVTISNLDYFKFWIQLKQTIHPA